MTDIDDFIMGGSTAPSAKFPTVGTVVEGTIEAIGKAQQTTIDGKPKFWDNGDPMMQAVVTLQTTERDPSIEGDTGLRRLFAAGGKQTNAKGDAHSMLVAIREAVKAAKADHPETGGHLAVKYVEDGKAANAGFNPPKLYRAKYTPPVAGPSADDLF